MRIQEFDYSVDLMQSILWQYNEAVNLISLLSQKQEWYTENQSSFWLDWYSNVFDLRTANFFGLSVWSYILNLPLFVPLNPDPVDKPVWGFNFYDPSFPTLGNSYLNFGNGNFSTIGQIVTLTLEEQRFILRLRYYQLVTNGATYTKQTEVDNGTALRGINSFLSYLISTSAIDPIGPMWALDGLDMSMTYVFGFNISPNLKYILVRYDLLPRPAAVGIKYLVLSDTVWGFNADLTPFPDVTYENDNQNFNNGNFITPFLIGD